MLVHYLEFLHSCNQLKPLAFVKQPTANPHFPSFYPLLPPYSTGKIAKRGAELTSCLVYNALQQTGSEYVRLTRQQGHSMAYLPCLPCLPATAANTQVTTTMPSFL